MATRSFLADIIKSRIEGLLAEADAQNRFSAEIEPKALKDAYIALGKAFWLPMEAQRQQHDVIEHLNRTIIRLEAILELVSLLRGDSEATLDTQDMVDIAFVNAYNRTMKKAREPAQAAG